MVNQITVLTKTVKLYVLDPPHPQHSPLLFLPLFKPEIHISAPTDRAENIYSFLSFQIKLNIKFLSYITIIFLFDFILL